MGPPIVSALPTGERSGCAWARTRPPLTPAALRHPPPTPASLRPVAPGVTGGLTALFRALGLRYNSGATGKITVNILLHKKSRL